MINRNNHKNPYGSYQIFNNWQHAVYDDDDYNVNVLGKIRKNRQLRNKHIKNTVSKLVDYKADINQYDNRGQTPLHIAVTTRNHVMVQSLLDKKADVNRRQKVLSNEEKEAIGPDFIQETEENTPLHLILDKDFLLASIKFSEDETKFNTLPPQEYILLFFS